MKTFTKKDIIDLVPRWNNEGWEYETKKNHLDKIMEFLLETDLLEWHNKVKKVYGVNNVKEVTKIKKRKKTNDRKMVKNIKRIKKVRKGPYFLNEEINLIQESKGNYIGYEYNVITTVLLISLCENENEPYFQKIIRGQYTTEEEAEEWLEKVNDTIVEQRNLWEKYGDEREWGVISHNIADICYSLTKLERNKTEVNIIKDQVNLFYTRFMALPDDKMIEFYNELGKNRIKYLNKGIDKKVNGEKDDKGNINGGLDKAEKSLYKIDLGLIEEKVRKNR
ncbi:hypothetical protein NBE98_08580 [Clostridium swellfunianum]|uniref:hypothetical protein n=1 Tax=Clostridium swellfunianum TaxID=1367462 RepID=UPI00202E2D37|nr:hypothetical protein [Clostridium swellfunianum]MCM0648428.1 hypothetical protein [Clostridium swellfunianum]